MASKLWVNGVLNRQVIAKDADTALKVNISWHFFYPGSSTTPWQMEGVIRSTFLIDADGVVFSRLDNVVDRTELSDELDRLLA